jgi:hypothetical protein
LVTLSSTHLREHLRGGRGIIIRPAQLSIEMGP